MARGTSKTTANRRHRGHLRNHLVGAAEQKLPHGKRESSWVSLKGFAVAGFHIKHLDRCLTQCRLVFCRSSFQERVGAIMHWKRHLGLDPLLGCVGRVLRTHHIMSTDRDE